jgi:hypothetical protein
MQSPARRIIMPHYNPLVRVFPQRLRHRLLLLAGPCAAIGLVLLALDGNAQAPQGFASHVASLSEGGGYFDTDNLISNERSYLQILPDLREGGVRGGAYIGVGPDTNFSYVAAVRPEIAFIVDIRRDNLLLHLLFKALFDLSASRVEYLAHLLGRPLPPAVQGWRGAPIDRLVTYFDRPPLGADALSALRKRVDDSIARTGVALSAEDSATITRFHNRFIEAGLELRFNSIGRPPQYYYPTYRQLLVETDSAGQQASYLASEDAFQVIKTLHARHLIIPVVGDLSGPSAMTAIGRLLATRKERLSAFYTSNVEFYLYGQGSFPRFIANLRQIPRTKNSVIIRSVFGRYLPSGRPGDGSTSQLQSIEHLVEGSAKGRFRSYGELVGRGQ